MTRALWPLLVALVGCGESATARPGLGPDTGGSPPPPAGAMAGALGNSALQELVLREVCGVGTAAIIGISALFDCGPAGNVVMFDESLPPINYVTTAVLEETLLCQDRDAAFAGFRSKYPQVGVFQEAL